MKFKVSLLLIVFACSLNAQNLSDTISLRSDFKGFQYIHQGIEIKANDVYLLMESNEMAYDVFNVSREAYFFGNIFGILGSALIVYPFASSALGNNPNYGPAFAGLCFIGISIPIFRSYNKNTVLAIYMYNEGIKKPIEPKSEADFSINIGQNGVGIKYSF